MELDPAPGATVTVLGSAATTVAPDLGRVAFSVTANAADRAGALAGCEPKAAAARREIEAATVLRFAVRSVFVNELTEWRNERSVIVGYAATARGWFDASDAAVIATLVGRLVASADASIEGVSWRLLDDNPVHTKVRQDAVRAAIATRRDYAEAAGLALGGLVSIADPGLTPGSHDPNGSDPRARMAMFAEAAPSITLDADEQHVSARVVARFLLRPRN